MTAIDFVAEHIMSFRRRKCEGTLGGGDVTSSGYYSHVSVARSWFYCDWCGAMRQYDEPVPPCPAYPFPAFSLVDLMRRLGHEGIPTIVRFDTMRESDRFTIIDPEGRVCDTDDPLTDFCVYLAEKYNGDGITCRKT